MNIRMRVYGRIHSRVDSRLENLVWRQACRPVWSRADDRVFVRIYTRAIEEIDR
jgi:hypothetical protein